MITSFKNNDNINKHNNIQNQNDLKKTIIKINSVK